jgi:hypothetical protein
MHGVIPPRRPTPYGRREWRLSDYLLSGLVLSLVGIGTVLAFASMSPPINFSRVDRWPAWAIEPTPARKVRKQERYW